MRDGRAAAAAQGIYSLPTGSAEILPIGAVEVLQLLDNPYCIYYSVTGLSSQVVTYQDFRRPESESDED